MYLLFEWKIKTKSAILDSVIISSNSTFLAELCDVFIEIQRYYESQFAIVFVQAKMLHKFWARSEFVDLWYFAVRFIIHETACNVKQLSHTAVMLCL